LLLAGAASNCVGGRSAEAVPPRHGARSSSARIDTTAHVSVAARSLSLLYPVGWPGFANGGIGGLQDV